MAKSVSYAVSSRETNIIQRAFRLEGWYWSRVIRHLIRILPCFIHFIIYLNRRVYRVFTISYISTMPLIIHLFYENFEFFLKIFKFFEFLNIFLIMKMDENLDFLGEFEILWNWKILKFYETGKFWNFENFCHVLYTLSYI